MSNKRASPRSITLAMAECLYTDARMPGYFPPRPSECQEIYSIFAVEINRRTKKLKTSQTENVPTYLSGRPRAPILSPPSLNNENEVVSSAFSRVEISGPGWQSKAYVLVAIVARLTIP